MSGHSKWSTIKHKKAATDARRGKMFTKILREIMAAAKLGGGDPKGNPRLRTALQEARSNSVPNDNIERAVKKGTGELEGEAYEELLYEGYGPGGVAVLIEAMTDNRNRTAQEVRFIFGKHGGNLGESGSVGWMFERRGYFVIDAAALNEEAAMELALELGAEDVTVGEEAHEIFTSVEDFATIAEELEQRKVAVLTKQVAMIPTTPVEIPAGKSNQVMRLVEALEDHDDVQNVWANFEISEKAEEAH
jgi:YebC/PmpR family DNA-binding regulatory protein